MITRAAIVKEAREWVGVRWRHQASNKKHGTDCIGLIAGVGKELGMPEANRWVSDARRTSYGHQPDPVMLRATVLEYLVPIPVTSVYLGDILMMKFEVEPQHFAIVSCMDPYRIIHAYAQVRKVVENGVDRLWQSRIVAAYQYRGIVE